MPDEGNVMADVKQILVVDDHFEMLEFLRSMLELSSREYQVLGVPSAEEAYMELRRVPFDLLITDVRLPGMSGFELVRRIRPYWPHMPVIMITAYTSAQGQQEAADLGIYRYFQKPLDTEALLSSVHSALYGQLEQPASPPAVHEERELEKEFAVSNDVYRCLETLQTDTGAAQAILATIMGDVVYTSRNQSGLDIPRLARIAAAGLDTSFQLAEELHSETPFTIQYQAGQRFDLYSANVGRSHFVMLIFDARLRRGRIGTVWIFAQRAIRELAQLLAALRPELPPVATPQPALETKPPQETATPPAAETVNQEQPTSATETQATTPPAEEELPPELMSDPLFELLDSNLEDVELDLDAFWESALVDDPNGRTTDGLSYEEALRSGLISNDLSEPGKDFS